MQRFKVNAWDEPATYDIVFCRYMLQHLSQPVALLRRMWTAVRPGGVIIVEDADFDGWGSHPANDGFAFFVRAYCEVIARWGGDHAFGRKLYASFLEAGIPGAHVDLFSPLHIADEGKSLALLTLKAIGAAILAEGIASEEQLHTALEDLAAFTAEPHSLMFGPRVFQSGGGARPRLAPAQG
jgi:SAM-dependent methyltransferase